jgi:hypothetical protein
MSSTQQLLLGEGAGGAAPAYIEEVFSTYLYTGTDATLAIPNGIDLSTKGGLVWIKNRTTNSSFGGNHQLVDTVRGLGTTSGGSMISTNNTDASSGTNGYNASTQGFSSFDTTGFTVKSSGGEVYSGACNTSGVSYTSWTFREQPKFFDIVTWTGNGSNPRTIAHNLGSVPGCVIVKETNASGSWAVWHRSLGDGYRIILNSTNGRTNISADDWFGSSDSTFTSTNFSVGNNLNTSGRTLVAYLFAHDAGGFGASGTDNVISCGTFTIGGSDSATVTLGYEPQWLLFKRRNSNSNWQLVDSMRGMTDNGSNQTDSALFPNTSDAEVLSAYANPTSTGFVYHADGSGVSGDPYIYIAIRRGLMKVPTTGTSVFQPVAYTGTNVDNRLVNTGIVTDAIIARLRGDLADTIMSNRLQTDYMNFTNLTNAEASYADGLDTAPDGKGNSFTSMTGFYVGNSASTQLNQASTAQLAYAFRRAPSFMDVVCYTGTGSNRTISHNLAAVPELMIVKNRSASANWTVYSSATGNTNALLLNDTTGSFAAATTWNNTTPTSSVFSIGTSSAVNTSAATYVAYLFATCAGVSKVGSYTGTGATQNIDCGFTGGARFVLIKRANSTGAWYYWDTARGIVAGNDPYLFLNSSNAEVTNTDYVDTYSAGFAISSTAPSAINGSGDSFIFLAIA